LTDKNIAKLGWKLGQCTDLHELVHFDTTKCGVVDIIY